MRAPWRHTARRACDASATKSSTPPYGWMYLLLQLEDDVPAAGSRGLFAALATVLYLSRNADWFRIGQPSEGARPAT